MERWQLFTDGVRNRNQAQTIKHKEEKRRQVGLRNIIKTVEDEQDIPDLPKLYVKEEIYSLDDMIQNWTNRSEKNLNKYLSKNPEQFDIFHQQLDLNKKKWQFNPVNECIKFIEKSDKRIIGDFGCGNGDIHEHFKNNDEIKVYSFDLVAKKPFVIECGINDLTRVNITNDFFDIVVCCLSLMGDYMLTINEAYRTLKTDGILIIYETKKLVDNVENFTKQIKAIGFTLTETKKYHDVPFINFVFVKN